MKADILARQLEKAVTKINVHCLVQTDTKKQFQGCKLERECMIDKELKERRMSAAGRHGEENDLLIKATSHQIRSRASFYDADCRIG